MADILAKNRTRASDGGRIGRAIMLGITSPVPFGTLYPLRLATHLGTLRNGPVGPVGPADTERVLASRLRTFRDGHELPSGEIRTP